MNEFLAWALASPWALQPERMEAYAAVLARRYAAKWGAEGAQADAAEAGPVAARGSASRAGAIAVVPVYGTIVQRASQLGLCEGGTSTQALSQALRQASADDSVSAVLLDIDSPGGSVYGVAELAAEIRGSSKPVTAIANSLAASAAYWIGSQAAEFFVTPGGEVGSIGVWMAHQSFEGALKQAGVDVTLISAGKYKVEGHPYGPLGEDARAFLQSRVSDYYNAFTRDVAKGRKTTADAVRSGMGEGRVLGAQAAKEQGMVDGVMTFDQVVAHMQRSLRAAAPGRSALAAARMELDLLG